MSKAKFYNHGVYFCAVNQCPHKDVKVWVTPTAFLVALKEFRGQKDVSPPVG